MEVNYLYSLDSASKFVDMGTHIFSKTNQSSFEPIKFEIVGLEKDTSQDSGFTLVLNDGLQDYATITEQTSEVQTESRPGKNIV